METMNVPVDITNTFLKTDRLLLRPWTLADLDDFYAYASVDGVGQMAGWKPHQNKEESVKILKSFMNEKKTFALEYQGQVVGSLGIEKYAEEKFPELIDQRGRELGFVLAKNCWGQGLMPEAVQAVIAYLFDELDLDFIMCGHFLSNKQSARVQEKCGFHPYAQAIIETAVGNMLCEENILWKEEFSQSRSVQ